MLSTHPKHDVFQAIADPTRRELLKLLADKEMPIASIVDCFPISRTAINKHLHILSDAGLVHSRKMGRETRYKLQAQPLTQVKEWLTFFEAYWDVKLQALMKYVEGDK